MDIMDSSDTPQGGLHDRSSASTAVSPKLSDHSALPLSVDEDSDRLSAASLSASSASGSHSLFGSSSDSMRLADNNDQMNDKPTSQDDVFMPNTQHEASLSDRMAASMSSVKDKLEAGLQSAQKEFKEGAHQVENKMDSMKADYHKNHQSTSAPSQSLSSPLSAEAALGLPQDTTDPTDGVTDPSLHHHNRTGSSEQSGDSLVHPYTSNMRDADQHPGLVSLVSHANEHSAVSPLNNSHVSDAQQRGIDAGSAAHDSEPKDDSAMSSNKGAAASMTGALSSMNAKLEEGVEAIKGKVEEWRHSGHTTSDQSSTGSPKTHTSDSVTGTSMDQRIPTLINQDDAVMSEQVRLRQKQGNME